MHLFEQPLASSRWVYACSLGDIEEQLSLVPESDLEGLWAIGLCASTQKDCTANGRYFYGAKPTIHLYSYPASLQYKQPAHVKWSEMEAGLAVELGYGMAVVQQGSRWVCCWERESLRKFILEHVLLHEIGHHVYHTGRHRKGIEYRPFTIEAEQFAEDYAARCLRPSKAR